MHAVTKVRGGGGVRTGPSRQRLVDWTQKMKPQELGRHTYISLKSSFPKHSKINLLIVLICYSIVPICYSMIVGGGGVMDKILISCIDAELLMKKGSRANFDF